MSHGLHFAEGELPFSFARSTQEQEGLQMRAGLAYSHSARRLQTQILRKTAYTQRMIDAKIHGQGHNDAHNGPCQNKDSMLSVATILNSDGLRCPKEADD